jgi:hypothetical protein
VPHQVRDHCCQRKVLKKTASSALEKIGAVVAEGDDASVTAMPVDAEELEVKVVVAASMDSMASDTMQVKVERRIAK